MKCNSLTPERSKEIVTLFTDVFSDSEGLEEGALIGHLVSELLSTTDKEDLMGYICVAEGKAVAGVFLSRIWLSSGKRAFILSPVAVSSKEQQKGVGQRLIRYAIERLQEQAVELLFTYGDPNYYSRFGSP